MAIRVRVYDDESIEQGLKRFKRMCVKEGLKKSIKRNSFYEKPSDRRRRKDKERLRSIRKAARVKLKYVKQAMKRARRTTGGPAKPTLRRSGPHSHAGASSGGE